jgi:predicted DNA-binding transcriptional regulator AlpA
MSERFLTLAEVEHRINRKKTSIYNLLKSGEFPRRYKFGWLESEVDQFIKEVCERERNSYLVK